MVARSSSWQQLGREQYSSPDSWLNRAYFACMVGLACFLLLCLIWPKSDPSEQVQANIEVITDPATFDSELLTELLEEAKTEVLSDESVTDLVSLAAASYFQGTSEQLPFDENTCAAWLREQVAFRRTEGELSGYQVIEVSGRGLAGILSAELINQLAIALSDRMNQKLLQERVFVQWERHQADLEDSLRYRREWVSDLELAIEQQHEAVDDLLALQDSGTQTGVPVSFASSTHAPESPSTQDVDVELLLADIQMKQDQLLELAARNNWSGAHPEFQNRIRQIELLQDQAQRLSEQARIPSMSNRAGQLRIEENEFYHRSNQTAVVGKQIEDARSLLERQAQDVSALQAEARQWLGREEQLNAELQSWIDQIVTGPSLESLRLIELAQQPEIARRAIPAGQWLLMCLMSVGAATGVAFTLNRRPTLFASTSDVATQLGLPVLGSLPGAKKRLNLVGVLKQHQVKLRWVAEIVVLITALMILLAAMSDSRLFPLLVQNPFDGLARALQVFRGL